MVAGVRALNRVYQVVYKLSTYFYTKGQEEKISLIQKYLT